MTALSLRSCSPCRTKKRQCDRLLPSCSRCTRVSQICVYGEYMRPEIDVGGALRDLKSPLACLVCKRAKRPCGREMPQCSRCKRLGFVCEYNVQLAYNQQALVAAPLAEALVAPDGSAMAPPTAAAATTTTTSFFYTPPAFLLALEPSVRADYPIESRNYIPGLINHFCSFSFSPVTAAVPNSLAVHLRTAWIRHAMVDPCLFHSTLFSASAQIDHLHGVPESTRTTYHSMQTVRLLRRKLEDRTTRGNYETAAAVLALALFNMRLDRLGIALTHRTGLLKMLGFLQGEGQQLAELVSLIKVMLIVFSMIVPQGPPFPAGCTNARVAGTPPLDPRPSDILESILERDAETKPNTLSGIIPRAAIQHVWDIVTHSQPSQGIIHDAETLALSSHPITRAEPPLIHTSTHQPTTPHDITLCCTSAAAIFHSILATPPSKTPSQPKSTIGQTFPKSLQTLRTLLRKVGFTSWLQNAPEAYLWICITAAASTDNVTLRAGFVMMSMPILLALETTELAISRRAYAYFGWLEGVKKQGNREAGCD
ncbi:hypothetical protein BJX64DRAFT_141618 [Aspergillus heterothallicus]